MRATRPTVALIELALGTLATISATRSWLKHHVHAADRIETKLDLLLEERGVR